MAVIDGIEMKPCPFCGSEDIRFIGVSCFYVSCNNCFATTGKVDNSRKVAAEQWNRRSNNG